MEHHFEVNIAKDYGINIATFLHNIVFWIRKNKANKKHFHEGRYWTYNSSEALTELFPYWSEDQMDRIIKKCVEHGLLLTNNFNENTYNRTRWYSLTDFGMKLFDITIPRKRGMETAKKKTPFRENAESIKGTDSKPDIKPNRAIVPPVDKSKPDKKSPLRPVKRKSSSVCLTSIPDDFLPDEYGNLKLYEVAVKTHNSIHALRDKFIEVSKKYATKSDNWQKTFIEFLERERPARVYEDAKGKRQRYDGKALY